MNLPPRRSLVLALPLFAALAVSHASVGAQPADSSGTSAVTPNRAAANSGRATHADAVGARIQLLRSLFADSKPPEGLFRGAHPGSVDADGFVASIRLAREPGAETIDRLEGNGLAFFDDQGWSTPAGFVLLARVPWSELRELAGDPLVRRIEAAWGPLGPSPLQVTARKTGVAAVRRDRGLRLDGDGVVFGDIDADFDIYHPHLFRADGGYYDWVDVDGDGTFDPGKDGVDLDDNGRIAPNEHLRVLESTVLGASTANSGDEDSPDPDRDWLYVDENGDGRRNVGPAAGFDEDDPAYGEPLFVVDDVDGDGTLEPREKLVRLDTSKFRLVVDGEKAYVRGRNLAERGRSDQTGRSFHGLGVASILAGGQPQFHRRIGLAPEAELVGYTVPDEPTEIGEFGRHHDYVRDAAEREVDVLVHEWSNLFATAQDGSTNLEATMDAARERGVLQVTPTGNLNLSKKHVERTMEPDEPTELGIRVGDGFGSGGRSRPYRRFWGSLYWRSDQTPDVELATPEGSTIELSGADGRERRLASYRVVATFSRSSRGTAHLLFAVWTSDSEANLESGRWSIRVSEVEERDELVGRVVDQHSSWSVGIHWENPTRDEGTMVYPSTADSAVGVGAYGGRRNEPEDGPSGSEVGELRNYSGRGPRIDGHRVTDLTAPDDPIVAMTPSTDSPDGYDRVPFRRFGGTSGAAPHVAATLGLLRQHHPDATADRLETRLYEAARTNMLDPDLGELPNRGWGHGRVDLHRALRDESPPPVGQPPDAELVVDVEGSTLVLDASGSTDPDGDDLEYRFDVEYDGRWETDWQSRPDLERPEPQTEAPLVSRVWVRDPAGNVAGALASPPPAEAEAETTDAGLDSGPSDATDDIAEPAGETSRCRGCGHRTPAAPFSGLLLLIASGTLVARRKHR